MASRRGRSKKQSVGSRERQLSLPEDFVLYLDENLHNCKPILDALVQRGVKHERHGSHFPPGAEDTTWLPFVGQQGWLLVTKDFTSGNYSGAEMAWMLVAALPEMIKLCRKRNPPFIASITKSGKVNLRFPQPSS